MGPGGVALHVLYFPDSSEEAMLYTMLVVGSEKSRAAVP